MYRSKNFILMNVEDSKGKRLGVVKDLLLDFRDLKLTGFILSSYSVFSKDIVINIEDVITFNDFMIISRIGEKRGVPLSKVKNLDTIDICGNTVGIVEDFLFSVETLKIEALVLSTGIIKNFLYGKRIILPKDFIIGNNSVIYYPKDKNIIMISKIHNIGKEDDDDECQ